MMRAVLLAVAVAALAGPALAQSKVNNFGRGHQAPKQTHPQVDEEKYKAAIQSIPDAKVNDPWASVRTPDAPPSATVAPAKKPVR
jgi:hypothetical protein